MNLVSQLLAALLTVTALMSGNGTASARAVIDVGPVVSAYEECVERSGGNLAYRCASSMDVIVGEFDWPSGGPDPRLGPVYVEDGVFICANMANVLMLSTTVPSTGSGVVFALNSPSACAGERTGAPGPITTMEMNAQYDPMKQLTLIRFENDLGEESFHQGVCTLTPGNLAVFITEPDGTREITVLYSPTVCTGKP